MQGLQEDRSELDVERKTQSQGKRTSPQGTRAVQKKKSAGGNETQPAQTLSKYLTEVGRKLGKQLHCVVRTTRWRRSRGFF